MSSAQFDRNALDSLFDLADALVPVARGLKKSRVLEGAVLASLFFEPSTRTRLSFETAFNRLGGSVVGVVGAEASSITKGESIADTSRVVSGYADVMVVRHPRPGAATEFAHAARVPVINGGDGDGEHPTQALLDVYTMRGELGRWGKTIDRSRIALVGDLKHGRAVHSLARLLTVFEGLTLVFIAPSGMEAAGSLCDLARSRGHDIVIADSLRDGLPGCDLLYATRVQKERRSGRANGYGRDFRIDRALIDETCSAQTVIMHPMPRDATPGANDLSADLDADPRLAMFRQAEAGTPVRMALFAFLCGVGAQVTASLQPTAWQRADT